MTTPTFASATTQSKFPSRLKSATARATGPHSPTHPGSGVRIGSPKLPSPPLSITLIAPGTMLSLTAKSESPSPLKSPATDAQVGIPRSRLGRAWNEPSPLDKSTATLAPRESLTAKSEIPSPLRSPATTHCGAVPASRLRGARNVPSPLPNNTEASSEPALATTRSGTASLFRRTTSQRMTAAMSTSSIAPIPACTSCR